MGCGDAKPAIPLAAAIPWATERNLHRPGEPTAGIVPMAGGGPTGCGDPMAWPAAALSPVAAPRPGTTSALWRRLQACGDALRSNGPMARGTLVVSGELMGSSDSMGSGGRMVCSDSMNSINGLAIGVSHHLAVFSSHYQRLQDPVSLNPLRGLEFLQRRGRRVRVAKTRRHCLWKATCPT